MAEEASRSSGKGADRDEVRRLSLGNAGDVKPIGEGLSEMRIDYGPGYRVYFMQRSSVLVILLCGGDKSSQQKDIVRAQEIAAAWEY